MRGVTKESQILQQLSHEHIIEHKDFFHEKHYMCIVTDHMTMDLFRHMNSHYNKFTEPEIRSIFKKVAKSVSHCHESGIVHRDIKPENILVDFDVYGQVTNLKLTDFGHACASSETDKKVNGNDIGTLGYVSPEVYLEQCEDFKKLDSWALGVLLFNLVTGKMPFEGPTKKVISQVTDPKK